MLNIEQLRELIISPTLDALQLYSDDAVELLVFTCAVESNGGSYLKQINGSALGIYQIEPATYHDIWQNYLRHRADYLLLLSTQFHANNVPNEYRLVYDLNYATAMARLHYRRVSMVLPSRHNVDDMWEYYKQYYNTQQGKAEKKSSIKKYRSFLRDSSIPDSKLFVPDSLGNG